jgi:hypothetical protein
MLKNFHMFFIAVSVMLALVTTVWAFTNGAPILGILVLAVGGGLVVYLDRFRRKAQRMGLS